MILPDVYSDIPDIPAGTPALVAASTFFDAERWMAGSSPLGSGSGARP
jgi:hypothetical protein